MKDPLARTAIRLNLSVEKHSSRYLLAIAVVAVSFRLRLGLIHLTGAGAPFVFFFGAVMVTSLLAGAGPGIVALLISVPLAANSFVLHAGYPLSQAVFQSLLFIVDGLVVIYLSHQTRRGREAAQDANRQLRRANEELRESEERFRLTIDEAPIGMALVALDGRFVRVNHALCEIVGYSSDELTALTFQAITHLDDLKADLAAAGQLLRGEIRIYNN